MNDIFRPFWEKALNPGAEARQMSEWQPISTAPKDETHILIHYRFNLDSEFTWTSEGWWNTEYGWWMTPSAYDVHPTDWQPLPEPPRSA